MRLVDVIKKVECVAISGDTNVEISGVFDHSAKVKPGGIFVCIKGANNNSHCMIDEAVKNKAVAVVVELCQIRTREDVTVIVVRNSRKALSVMCSNWYNDPWKSLFMVGITGTKGKTSTAYMIRHICERAGLKTGIIGSVEIRFGDRIIETDNTTPGPIILQKALYDMKMSEVDIVIMEVSSQGLMQSRVWGMIFDVGVFTNLSYDHIGANEHESLKEYFYYKCQLFRYSRHWVINADDYYGRLILSNIHEKTGYTLSENDYYKLKINLPGTFSLYNALAAAKVCGIILNKYGILSADSIIRESLKDVKVPGRLEIISGDNGFDVIVDYAHNEQSLKQLLATVVEYRKIITIFGCGGNRAKARRYGMGRVSALYSDLIIVTSDNPRYEDPLSIMKDIECGIMDCCTFGKKPLVDHILIADRKEAIRYGLSMARQGDIVIIAGKGHETYQEINGIRYPMNDVDIVNEYLGRI